MYNIKLYMHFTFKIIYPSTAFSLLVSTVSVFLLYVVHDETVVVIMLCLFSALSTPAWNDSTLIVAEVYPTHLR